LENLELIPNDNSNGFYLVEHSEDNLKKCIPTTKSNIDWKIMLMMEKIIDDQLWLKTALLNPENGKIALLTSTNNLTNLTNDGHRGIKSIFSDGWYIGHYRMSAPYIFWKELQNRIKYSFSF